MLGWRGGRGARAAVLLALGAALLLLPQRLAAQQDDPLDCSSCHDSGQKVGKSAHSSVGCAECHTGIKEYPHPEKLAKPDCASCHPGESGGFSRSVHGVEAKAGNGAAPGCSVCHGEPHETQRSHTVEYRKGVPEMCGMCHGEVLEKFQQSVHAKAVAAGKMDSAVCTDCHGEHSIQRPKESASAVNPSHVPDTCGRCHGDLRLASRFGLPADRIASFDSSFHGLALKSGSQRVANCASCHGYHDILPSSDPKSMTSTANLSKTCGQCHPGAGQRFAIGQIHLAEGDRLPEPLRLARLFYIVVIPLTIGLMLLHHGGDFVRKVLHLRFGPPHVVVHVSDGSHELRMYPIERLQHALLVISFFVLVWTGFALKYPDQFWARPLLAWESEFPLRGWIHRIAGAVMIAVSIFHIVTIAASRKLRHHWLELLPRRWDAVEGFRMLAYNLGLRKEKPAVSSHSYIEKAEYWAVVWGTGVMAITGLMLWSTNFMLAYLPKMWLDFATTVHFYEAVLATLAILVWHFYSVIFDPDVYPLETAWLTGKSVRRRHKPLLADSHSGHPEAAPEPPKETAESKAEAKSDPAGADPA